MFSDMGIYPDKLVFLVNGYILSLFRLTPICTLFKIIQKIFVTLGFEIGVSFDTSLNVSLYKKFSNKISDFYIVCLILKCNR